MTLVLDRVIEDHLLYEVSSLALVGRHRDRSLAPNIDQGGNVHLNILEPGARAGNHYHVHLHELFINPGPGKLLLHLRDPQNGSVETVELSPLSLTQARAYRAKLGVPHMVENPNPYRATLIIVVDRDDPNDIVPAPVYLPRWAGE